MSDVDDRHPIYSLSDGLVDQLVEMFPELATELGIPGSDHLWNDYSPQGIAALRDLYAAHLALIKAMPTAPDDRWGTLAVRVVARFLEDQVASIDHHDHERDVNNIACPFQAIRDIFDLMDRETTDGWENIAARLETIGQPLLGYQATLEKGRAAGLVAAKRQVEAVIDQGRVHAGPGSFFDSLAADARLANLPAALESRLVAATATAKAAFGAAADYFADTYLADAVEKDAVGAQRHGRAAREFLGMEIDPVATYAWGWDQVAWLRSRMDDVAGQIAPGKSLGEVIEILKSDPDRGVEGVEAFKEFIAARQQIALDELDGSHFDIPENIRKVDVKIAPPGGALGAYYMAPSEDFSRPGSVWWSVGDKTFFPLYDEVSTAYHEGFPGHHLQVGLAAGLADKLSRMHRMLIWYPGYGEGWALYAEQVMDEEGYLEKPDYEMGFLAGQMLRACRVVIDIGSHLELEIPDDQPFHPGEDWTFETGVELLREYAALDKDYAESEVTRYLGWPAQAISYKIGQKVIADLREEVMERDGDQFSMKKFHSDILEYGPVGLDLLRELVLG